MKQQKLAKRLKSWGVDCDLPTARFWALQAEERQMSFGEVESQGTKSQSCAGPWNPGQNSRSSQSHSLSLSSQSSKESLISQMPSNATSGLVLTGNLLSPAYVRGNVGKVGSL